MSRSAVPVIPRRWCSCARASILLYFSSLVLSFAILSCLFWQHYCLTVTKTKFNGRLYCLQPSSGPFASSFLHVPDATPLALLEAELAASTQFHSGFGNINFLLMEICISLLVCLIIVFF